MHAFFEPHGEGWRATPLTRGPWDVRFQHGGPPSALMTGAMARFGDDAEAFALARVTVELLAPVPIATLHVEVVPERLGRTVQRLRAVLRAGDRVVAEARALRIRRNPLALAEPEAPAWPDPDSVAPYTFGFFQHEVGYHKAIDLRCVDGAWGSTPIKFWARPTVPLVAGRDTLSVERLLILADAQSGMGVPVDPRRYTFLNPDLTVYLHREPRSDWLGFDIRSVAGPDGIGLAQSALRDLHGGLGRSAQSLVVSAR